MSTTKKKTQKYDTSFYSIRRAQPKDLPSIIDLIIAEPYFRWKQLVYVLFSNIYVTVTWFVGALLSMGFGVLMVNKYESLQIFQNRLSYIILSIFVAIIIFILCFAKGISLYFVRYIKAFEIQRELKTVDSKSDNIQYLANKKIYKFFKENNFYIAVPFDQASSQIVLGCISIASYADYCKSKEIDNNDFECITRAIPKGFKIISSQTVVISWLIINEKFFGNKHKLRNSIYNGLLKYIYKNKINETNINYVICESDDFLYWQHDILAENKYGFCGERIDLIWNFFHDITKDGYPNHRFFFIKICNISEQQLRRAMQREIEKDKKQNEKKKVQTQLL